MFIINRYVYNRYIYIDLYRYNTIKNNLHQQIKLLINILNIVNHISLWNE